MAVFCCVGCKLREAKAITTALSPDNKILATIIEPNANQNDASENAAINSIKSPQFLFFVVFLYSSLRESNNFFVTALPLIKPPFPMDYA